MSTPKARVSKGTPAGGEFKPTTHGDATGSLTDNTAVPVPVAVRCELDPFLRPVAVIPDDTARMLIAASNEGLFQVGQEWRSRVFTADKDPEITAVLEQISAEDGGSHCFTVGESGWNAGAVGENDWNTGERPWWDKANSEIQVPPFRRYVTGGWFFAK